MRNICETQCGTRYETQSTSITKQCQVRVPDVTRPKGANCVTPPYMGILSNTAYFTAIFQYMEI